MNAGWTQMSRTFRHRNFMGGLLLAAMGIALSGCDGGSNYEQTVEPPADQEPVTDQPAADPPVDMTIGPERETSANATESDFQVPPDIDSDAPAQQQTESEPDFSLPPDLNQPEN